MAPDNFDDWGFDAAKKLVQNHYNAVDPEDQLPIEAFAITSFSAIEGNWVAVLSVIDDPNFRYEVTYVGDEYDAVLNVYARISTTSTFDPKTELKE